MKAEHFGGRAWARLLLALTLGAIGVVPTALAQPVTATALQLPDGNVCHFAGTGATASFNGQRVNYTCGPAPNNGTVVILGNPTLQNGAWVLTEAITEPGNGGPQLRSSQTITMDISHVNLVDGQACDFAGSGGSVTVDGKRLNYTCGRPDVGLLGDFNTSNPLWTADRVHLAGSPSSFTITSRDQIGIGLAVGVTHSGGPAPAPSPTPAPQQATNIKLPDGSVCLFSGTGATLAFNGQRANYNCGIAPDGSTVVILGNPTLQSGNWVVQVGQVTPAPAGGFELASSQTVTMTITRVDLLDASTCLFAGTGATIVVDGQRMNYTCGQANVGLIGDFNTTNPLWTANRVSVAGPPPSPTVTSRDTPGIRSVTGQTPTTPQPAPPAPPQPAPGPTQPAPPQTRDGRYFAETNFRVANDAFWNYFQSSGAIDTFGFPVSRQFGFLGCQVQIFQRSIMQQCGDNAVVALLNLLDPELFPYTKVNGSTFPPADDAIKARTPVPGSPGYDQAIAQFVADVAPDTFDGQPDQFHQTFDDTGGLEIWGAPISNPAYDPNNRSFIYQRYQRGIMHFAVGQGTRGILLADYLKSILLGPDQAAKKGANLPADLDAQAKGSAQYAQYCPNQAGWLCRPTDLPGSDLTYAFEAG